MAVKDDMHRRPAAAEEKRSPLGAIRRMLLAILLLGVLATGTELLLLDHHGDVKQLIPVVLIALSLVVLAWHALRGGASSIRALQATMLLFIVSGIVGVVLHCRGRMEFQLEADSSLSGMKLFWKVMQAKAPPALAPGAMVELGLLGLVYAYRHPALARASDEGPTTTGD